MIIYWFNWLVLDSYCFVLACVELELIYVGFVTICLGFLLIRVDSRWFRVDCIGTRVLEQTWSNFCVKLFKIAKKNFCNSFDVKEITDNKLIWKAEKADFTNKTMRGERVTLLKMGKVF